MEGGPLSGLRVMIVEDDAMLALALDMALASAGCEIAALASNLAEATRLAREAAIDGAVLDVNLSGEMVYPVADILAARGIPFVFATGYGPAGLRPGDGGRPVLQKPYDLDTLAAIVRTWRRG